MTMRSPTSRTTTSAAFFSLAARAAATDRLGQRVVGVAIEDDARARIIEALRVARHRDAEAVGHEQTRDLHPDLGLTVPVEDLHARATRRTGRRSRVREHPGYQLLEIGVAHAVRVLGSTGPDGIDGQRA